MVGLAEFLQLLDRGEGESLDWKRDFGPGLIRGKSSRYWERDRGKLLKALVALANGEGDSTAFLVYGVQDDGTQRTVYGLARSWDDAMFQNWAHDAFEPTPTFTYNQLEVDNKKVGVFAIQRVPHYPHVVSKSVADVLFEGQVWFRRGSRNTLAGLEDLRRMVLGPEPFVLSSQLDPVFRDVAEHYRAEGRELVTVRRSDRDSRLAQGYGVAYYPGTRRPVMFLVDTGGAPEESVALLKPSQRQ